MILQLSMLAAARLRPNATITLRLYPVLHAAKLGESAFGLNPARTTRWLQYFYFCERALFSFSKPLQDKTFWILLPLVSATRAIYANKCGFT